MTVAALTLAVVALALGGVLRLRAPEAPKGPVVQAAPTDAPRVKAPERKQMPEDIYEWLKHLEECERQKGVLARSQGAEAQVAQLDLIKRQFEGVMSDSTPSTTPPTLERGSQLITDFKAPWLDLISFFESKTPPEKCKGTAADYSQHLREISSYMGDMNKIIRSVSAMMSGETDAGAEDTYRSQTEARKELEGMFDSNDEMIDKAGKSADDGVQHLCSDYDVRKWFSIKDPLEGMGQGLSLKGLGL